MHTFIEVLKILGLIILILISLSLIMSWALEEDLKEMEKTDPKFREYLKKKYKW